MFEGQPITANEKYIMRLDQVQKSFEEKEGPDALSNLLSALNPFSKYVIQELTRNQDSCKNWELDTQEFLASD
jgi:hypothetical protein